MGKKHSIIVFTGGYSGEAAISRKSAHMVMKHIDLDRFQPTLVHINEDGWFIDTEGQRRPTSLEHLMADAAGYIGAFVMVHGTPGEDGKLQAQLAASGFPHTTGSAEAMALTFHKGRTSELLRSHGIAVARSYQIPHEGSWKASEIIESLGLPCFVKPNETGSSIGIHKVTSEDQLDAAIHDAQAIGGMGGVVVESFLAGREFTSGVIPSADGTPMALPVTEIRTDRAFFDYAAKYEGESEEITPADIPENLRNRLQQLAIAVYNATHMRGLARVDMMSELDGEPHVIEINAVPGFSEASIIPKQAHALGLSKTALISRIIDQTLLS